MSDRVSTRERILEASRRLFNEKGYKATTLAEIAASIGIAQGNLTYHFPTKRELACEIETRVRHAVREQRSRPRSRSVADDYVDLILFAMNSAWEHRFLLRDYAQFKEDREPPRPDPDMSADLEELRELLARMEKEGLFRRDLEIDLRILARSLWIVSRYWMDHLRELEGLGRVTWADQERGVRHHLAILLPCLTAPAKREMQTAVRRAAGRLTAQRAHPG